MTTRNRQLKVLLSSVFIILLFFLPFNLFAEDLDSLFDAPSTSDELGLFEDENSLFSSDSLFAEEEPVLDNSGDLFNSLLGEDSEAIEITGSYSFNLKGGLTYDLITQDSPTYFLETPLSASFSLSARPSNDTRFFIKSNLSYPFDDGANISIKELFGDFTLADDYFFRVGKQTLNWGVGYFFSPANLLNITSIDPSDPTAELEGPLAVKINHPVGVDNLYAYVIVPDSTTLEPTDLIYAVKGEKIIGNMEFSLGGRYSFNEASAKPAIMATISAPVSSVINVFAEAVETYSNDEFNFSGTVGFSFLKNLEKISDVSLTLSAQYYYNQNSIIITPFGTTDSRHQLSGVISLSLPNNFSLSIASINVLSELSGVITPNVCYNVEDGLSICLGLNYSYGDFGSASPPGFNNSTIEPSIKITLGGGDF